MTLKLLFHSGVVYHVVNTDATMSKSSFLMYLHIYTTKTSAYSISLTGQYCPSKRHGQARQDVLL